MEIIFKHFDSLTSTNDLVKIYLRNIEKGQLLIVSADTQTAGRGQFGRQWFSPKGMNLYATFGFLAHIQHDPLFLTRLLATSTAGILKTLNISAQLKMPNDLLVNGKKIAGILCETTTLSCDFGIAIGIGLNVNMSKEILAQIDQPATSICEETGKTLTINSVLSQITDSFANQLSSLLSL